MTYAMFAGEIAALIAPKVGLRAEYIDVYPSDRGWDASLRNAPGVWSVAKSATVKQVARAFQTTYTLRKAAG